MGRVGVGGRGAKSQNGVPETTWDGKGGPKRIRTLARVSPFERLTAGPDPLPL